MDKASLRKKFITLRKQLPQQRRLEAKKALTKHLYPILSSFQCILSFASLSDEIDLWSLNQILAKENRLLLPRLENNQLVPYQTLQLDTCLEKSTHGFLEPKPASCKRIDKRDLDCILVPGLCFDKQNYRLGYGFGHFDRFLEGLHNPVSFGLGFKEQLISKLPVEAHDIPLTKLYLF